MDEVCPGAAAEELPDDECEGGEEACIVLYCTVLHCTVLYCTVPSMMARMVQSSQASEDSPPPQLHSVIPCAGEACKHQRTEHSISNCITNENMCIFFIISLFMFLH